MVPRGRRRRMEEIIMEDKLREGLKVQVKWWNQENENLKYDLSEEDVEHIVDRLIHENDYLWETMNEAIAEEIYNLKG